MRINCLLGEMNVAVRAEDERRIEVLASGLPLFHGAQLAVDITFRSALACNGEPRPGAARVNGSVCKRARADKETKYTELLAGDRCASSSWPWKRGAGGVPKQSSSSEAYGRNHPHRRSQPSWPGGDDGRV